MVWARVVSRELLTVWLVTHPQTKHSCQQLPEVTVYEWWLTLTLDDIAGFDPGHGQLMRELCDSDEGRWDVVSGTLRVWGSEDDETLSRVDLSYEVWLDPERSAAERERRHPSPVDDASDLPHDVSRESLVVWLVTHPRVERNRYVDDDGMVSDGWFLRLRLDGLDDPGMELIQELAVEVVVPVGPGDLTVEEHFDDDDPHVNLEFVVDRGIGHPAPTSA